MPPPRCGESRADGGDQVITNLCNIYGRKVSDGLLPIIALRSSGYKHKKYGRIEKPELPWRHAFLARLAGKINLDALATRNRTVSDLALSSMIAAALHCSARDDAAAKELDRLIKLHSDNN